MLVVNPKNHSYTYQGRRVPSVTDIINEEFPKQKNELDRIPRAILERAIQLGRNVHSTTEYHDKGTLNTVTLDPILAKYLEQWKRFCQDYEFEIRVIERAWYSMKWNYAGTTDRAGLIKIPKKRNKVWSIVDIKTVVALKPTTSFQTAGYGILAEENLGVDIRERFAVQLFQDRYVVTQYKPKEEYARFLSARSLYAYKEEKGLLFFNNNEPI